MRFLAIAIVLACLPAFISVLNAFPHRRNRAFAALGAMLFIAGSLRFTAFLYAWPYWNGTVRGLEISPVDMLCLALITTRRRSARGLPFWPVIWIYGFALLASFFMANVWVASTFVGWQYLRLVLLFAAIGGEIARPGVQIGLCNGLSIGLLIQAFYIAKEKASGVVQASGTMEHQNTLGMMAEVALLILLSALLSGRRGKLLVLGVIAALLVIAGGGSRGTTAFALVGALVLVTISTISNATPAKMRVIGFSALALSLAAPVAVATLHSRFGSRSVVTEETEREAFKRAARAIAEDHPFGVGANQYVTVANTQGYSQRAGVVWNFGSRSASVHNAYLLARAETGWLGEFAFIALLVVPVIRGIILYVKLKRENSGELILGSCVALLINIIHNNFEFVAFTYNVFCLLILCIAQIAGQVRAENAQDRLRMARSPGFKPSQRLVTG